MEREDYKVGVPCSGSYKLILDETVGSYEQAGVKPPVFKAYKQECDGQPYHVFNPMKPYGIQVYEFSVPTPRKPKEEAAPEKKPAAKKPAAKKVAEKAEEVKKTVKAAAKKAAAAVEKKPAAKKPAAKKTAKKAEEK